MVRDHADEIGVFSRYKNDFENKSQRQLVQEIGLQINFSKNVRKYKNELKCSSVALNL